MSGITIIRESNDSKSYLRCRTYRYYYEEIDCQTVSLLLVQYEKLIVYFCAYVSSPTFMRLVVGQIGMFESTIFAIQQIRSEANTLHIRRLETIV